MKPNPLLWSSLSTVKNYFAIAFTCVYLIMTVGVAKTTHYCMDRKYDSSLFTFEGKQCACALYAKKADKSCCSDEHEIVKIEDDQSQGQTISSNAPEFFEMGLLFEEPISNSLVASLCGSLSFFQDDSPPSPPIFKLNCSFVFYDDQLLA